MTMKFSWKTVLPPIDFGWNRVRAQCASSTCHNKLLSRAVPQSRVGIHAGQRWFCSPDCFAAGMQEPLALLAMGRVRQMPRNPRLSLGLALLSKGVLTEAQLRLASAHSRGRDEDLESTLRQMGLATEKQLAAARAAQWGHAFLAEDCPLHPVRVDLPLTLLRACHAVPLHYVPSAKRLVLGFVHRVEHGLLQSIEQITGCRPDPCFLTPAEFEEQTARVSLAPDYEEVASEEPGTPNHMARTLGGLASEVSAREVFWVPCESWVWVRVMGKRKTLDALFAVRPPRASRFEERPLAQAEFATLG
jgi:hypothetical protein